MAQESPEQQEFTVPVILAAFRRLSIILPFPARVPSLIAAADFPTIPVRNRHLENQTVGRPSKMTSLMYRLAASEFAGGRHGAVAQTKAAEVVCHWLRPVLEASLTFHRVVDGSGHLLSQPFHVSFLKEMRTMAKPAFLVQSTLPSQVPMIARVNGTVCVVWKKWAKPIISKASNISLGREIPPVGHFPEFRNVLHESASAGSRSLGTADTWRLHVRERVVAKRSEGWARVLSADGSCGPPLDR
jgi:hypothetical protein